jgi:hypothetical protein
LHFCRFICLKNFCCIWESNQLIIHFRQKRRGEAFRQKSKFKIFWSKASLRVLVNESGQIFGLSPQGVYFSKKDANKLVSLIQLKKRKAKLRGQYLIF